LPIALGISGITIAIIVIFFVGQAIYSVFKN
jgi:hypothetical protein